MEETKKNSQNEKDKAEKNPSPLERAIERERKTFKSGAGKEVKK